MMTLGPTTAATPVRGSTSRFATSRLALPAGLTLLALAAFPAAVPAAEVTWGVNGSTAWATTGNWLGGRPGSGDVAVFDGLGSANTRGLAQSSLGSLYSIQAIVVSGSQQTFTIGSSGGTALSLRLTGTTIDSFSNVILRNSGTGSLTIAPSTTGAGPMALDLGGGSDNVVRIDNSGAITISATVTGVSRLLTLSGTGSGALTLSASNSYTGTTQLLAGTLRAGHDSAFSSSLLQLNGGTLTGTGSVARSFTNNALTIGGSVTFGDATGTGALTFGGPISLSGTQTVWTVVSTTFAGAVANGSLTKDGAATLSLTNAASNFGTLAIAAGTVAIGANTTVAALAGSGGALTLMAGNTLTVNQATNGTAGMPFTGSGGFTKTGIGALTLTGNSGGYGGTTTVSGGTLVANGVLGGTVSVSGGAVLAGSGTVGSVTLSGGVISPGNSPGTLSVGDLSWDATSSYDWEIYDAGGTAGSTTGWDLIAGSGALSVSGTGFTFNLISLSGTNTRGTLPSTRWSQTTSGTFRIATFASISAPSGTWWTLNTGSFAPYNAALGFFSLVPTGTSLDIVYTHTPLSSYTYVAGSGVWSDVANWAEADTPEGNAAISFAGAGGLSTNDLPSGTGPNELTSVTSLTFTGSASGAYTVGGNALTLGAGGIVNESSFEQTIATKVTLGAAAAVTANAAALTLSGTVDTAAYALSVGGSAATTLGVVAGSGNLTKVGSGTATLTGSVAAPGVAVNAGSMVLNAPNLLLDSGSVTVAGGTLDLQSNADTVGSFAITAGSLVGSGTLTAATYALGGGTVSANLGTGAATSAAGSTTLAGTLAGSLTVAGGTVALGAADRIADGSAVTISAGSLGLGAFNDTVNSFAITGGVLGGSGTLTAGTYALTGGTVNANLGGGTLAANAGAATLNGSSGATTVTVAGGSLTTGGANKLADTAAVTLSAGGLTLGGNDTVGTYAQSGGTLGGSATLTAGTYALTGGTVNANLGGGTLTANAGVATLNGSSGATTVTVAGGSLTTGGANKLADTAAVTLSAGGLTLGGNDTVGTYAQSGGTLGGSATLTAGTYALTGGTVNANLGGGVVTAASGNTSIAGTVAATTVSITGGTLALASAGRLSTSATVTLSTGGLTLGGNETVSSYTQSGGTLAGSGTLTASNYSISGGTLSAALGSGTVTMSGGGLIGTPGRTISNAIVIGTGSGVAATAFSGYWNFTNGAAVATVTGSGVAFGDVTTNGAAPSLSTSSTSGGYTLASGIAASGGNNVSANAASGALSPSSTSIGFATTGTSGVTYLVNAVQFGSRSTSTGPQSLVLQSSADNYGSNLASASASNNSTWAAVNLAPTGTTASGLVSYRLYGVSGTGSGANWRVDDLYVAGTVYTPTIQSGSGTLGIDQPGAVTYSGPITVNNVAAFTAVAGGTATFAGAISGSTGAITKTGAGTVILAGTNTFGGGLTVSQGTLVGTTDSLKGSIANSAAVTFDQATNGTYAGAMTGSGSLTKTGVGALTLSAVQAFSGAATVAEGALVLAGADNLLAAASRIDVLAGASIDATSAGLTIGNTQTLGGYGTVAGDLTFDSGSVLAPGGSVGLLTGTSGNTVWNGGMTFAFEVNDANGVAGGPNGWDLFTTSGDLTLAADAENQILLTIASLSGTATGAAAGFNMNHNYAWKFVVAGSPINSFDAGWFNVNATGFESQNTTNGTFFVARGDQITAENLPSFTGGTSSELYVVYAAIPEPGTLTLAGIGAAVAAIALGRRRRPGNRT